MGMPYVKIHYVMFKFNMQRRYLECYLKCNPIEIDRLMSKNYMHLAWNIHPSSLKK